MATFGIFKSLLGMGTLLGLGDHLGADAKWTQKTRYVPIARNDAAHDEAARLKRERKATKLKRDMAKNKAMGQ